MNLKVDLQAPYHAIGLKNINAKESTDLRQSILPMQLTLIFTS